MTSQSTPDPAPERPGAPAPVPAPAQPDEQAPEPASPAREPETTAVYVRRRRVPTLAFWVTLAILVGLVAGAITAFVTGVGDVGGILYFAVTGGVFVGLPLALIAAIVDAVAHRSERRRPR
ncbi:hypothetical protein Bra3105_15470 [Brachybacterium halotolerans subsp. kimchii]|uniref:hypothetical protein n=1 Tax=Brachybacterium halotolerans TaxID=2795215 RepID=UPI001E6398B2|nr:hypothetical protein [Brachybacterium halotolerans]UEJ82222.1 hypothetical protein Bra3105_15470 [Brachybacterium halotolerans subsp. kimchii]